MTEINTDNSDALANKVDLPANTSTMHLIDALLKSHQKIYQAFHADKAMRQLLKLWLVTVLSLSIYGLIMGAFSMGLQWLFVPIKIVIITLLSGLLCFPSLYILAALSGANLSHKQAGTLLLSSLCLMSLLLLGFAPVAFVFTVSIVSLPFMGLIHLMIWLISLYFGLRFFKNGVQFLGGKDMVMIKVWVIIFLLTFAQMATTFRPILGEAKSIFVTEKLFFLEHWLQTLEIRR